jgi:hypothetical protein
LKAKIRKNNLSENADEGGEDASVLGETLLKRMNAYFNDEDSMID